MRKIIKYLLLIAFLLNLFPLVLADTYTSSSQKVEILIPSEGIKVDEYTVSAANAPGKVLAFSRFERIDNKTYRVKIENEKWEPGLYHISYTRGTLPHQEILFIAPTVYYGSPKLDSVLRQALYFSDKKDRESLRYFAESRLLELREDNDLVNVEIKVEKSSRDAIATIVEKLGGKVKNIGSTTLNTQVPLAALRGIADDNDVLFIDTVDAGDADEIMSQGALEMKAYLWHLAGYKGEGIKIAVVDGGFLNYQKSIACGDLPQNLIGMTFGYNSLDSEGADDHGTNCAEIVYDFAPEAQLYLIRVDSSMTEFEKLIDYLIEQKIDVVSRSHSIYQGAFNATSKWDKLVKKAKDAGIIWINSSGNRAQNHWEGYFKNDGKNKHIWTSSDTGIGTKKLYVLEKPFVKKWIADTRLKIPNAFENKKTLKFRLVWNDWGKDADGFLGGNALGQDYKLKLYCDGVLIAEQDTDQSNQDANPYETLNCFPGKPGIYEIEIEAKNNNDPQSYMELFMHTSSDVSFEYTMPESSVSIHGDSPDVITVGAVNAIYNTYAAVYKPPYQQKLENYSSCGPTNGIKSGPPDNTSIIKPDFCGVAGVETSAGIFGGTSAATPHVAGAAGLVLQAIREGKIVSQGDNEFDKVKNYLVSFTDKLGYPAKNNEVGEGLVVLNDQGVIGGIENKYATGEVADYLFPPFLLSKAFYKAEYQKLWIYGKKIALWEVDYGPGIENVYSPGYPWNLCANIVKLSICASKESIAFEPQKITLTNNLGQIEAFDFEVLSKSAYLAYVFDSDPINVIKQAPWSGEVEIRIDPYYYNATEPLKDLVGIPTNIDFGQGIIVKNIKEKDWGVSYLYYGDMEVKSDAEPGPRNLKVTFPDGTEVVGKNVLAVIAPPQITSIEPKYVQSGKTTLMRVYFDNLLKDYNPDEQEMDISLSMDISFSSEDVSFVEGKGAGPGFIKFNIKVDENAEPGGRTLTLFGMTGTFQVTRDYLKIRPPINSNPPYLKYRKNAHP